MDKLITQEIIHNFFKQLLKSQSFQHSNNSGHYELPFKTKNSDFIGQVQKFKVGQEQTFSSTIAYLTVV